MRKTVQEHASPTLARPLRTDLPLQQVLLSQTLFLCKEVSLVFGSHGGACGGTSCDNLHGDWQPKELDMCGATS